MHYGWPLLRNLTLLSILTQWYSNNRKFRHNIQTASIFPLYYFVRHWVNTDVLSLYLLRQLAWRCGTHRRRYLMQWEVVSCIVWAEHWGWSRVFQQKAPKIAEPWHRKSCQGWRNCHQTDSFHAGWEVKSCSPTGVPWEWRRKLQCLDINWRSSPRVWVVECVVPVSSR